MIASPVQSSVSPDLPRDLRLLLIEDSEDDALLIVHELKANGYACKWQRVETGDDLKEALSASTWDVITADYNMPQFNALQALLIVKESALDIPFIIVSGKIGEELAVAAMKAGAHDYVKKDNLSRLIPAIAREMRDAEERRGRKEAVKALRTQFEQISTIFDSMHALVYVADMDDYSLLFFNKFGTQGEELIGRKCHEVVHSGMSSPCGFCTNDKLVKDGEPLPPYIWEYENSATGRWYQCIDRAIRWTDGRLVRMEIAVDITERKAMEQLKEEMLSAVSHEMRTPLTAILGFTDYLMSEDVPKDQLKSCLGTIYKETERLDELIGNFLELQRLKARVEQNSFRAVPVQDLLLTATEIYRNASRQHEIVVDCAPNLPPIRGVAEQLHEVLTNLISNAIKYSPDGGTVLVTASQDDQFVTFCVKDEGIGIPRDVIDKIFDKFYRVDNTDRRKVGGTGLGLTLVREIVAEHGGRVWVESAQDKGSAFFFAIPVYHEVPTPAMS